MGLNRTDVRRVVDKIVKGVEKPSSMQAVVFRITLIED